MEEQIGNLQVMWGKLSLTLWETGSLGECFPCSMEKRCAKEAECLETACSDDRVDDCISISW